MTIVAPMPCCKHENIPQISWDVASRVLRVIFSVFTNFIHFFSLWLTPWFQRFFYEGSMKGLGRHYMATRQSVCGRMA